MRKIKILFICHGNICRSPMAEFLLRDMTAKLNVTSNFHIASAATSAEEIGNPVYPPARRELHKHGIGCGGHAARRITPEDYSRWDYLVGMDRANLSSMRRMWNGDPQGKVHALLDFAGRPGQDVADPWYTGDFEATWRDVLSGCRGLLEQMGQGR